jgi:hypothetical protein
VSYVFFGFEADTCLAAYLLEVIDRAIRTELATFRDPAGFARRARAASLSDVAVALSERRSY